MSLKITRQKPRWNITFRAVNIPHIIDGTPIGREIEAADRISALLMFKMSMHRDCEVISCEEVFGSRWGANNPATDVSKP